MFAYIIMYNNDATYYDKAADEIVLEADILSSIRVANHEMNERCNEDHRAHPAMEPNCTESQKS